MNSCSILLVISVAMVISSDSVSGRQAPTAPPVGAGATANIGAAEIQFETPVFDFGTAQLGDMVKHDFVFTNTGNAKLVISKVDPKCGCTVAKPWTQEVEPGKTGIIPIQFNTAGFNGPVTKYIGVTSNAKNAPDIILHLKGTVHTLVEVIPL